MYFPHCFSRVKVFGIVTPRCPSFFEPFMLILDWWCNSTAFVALLLLCRTIVHLFFGGRFVISALLQIYLSEIYIVASLKHLLMPDITGQSLYVLLEASSSIAWTYCVRKDAIYFMSSLRVDLVSQTSNRARPSGSRSSPQVLRTWTLLQLCVRPFRPSRD